MSCCSMRFVVAAVAASACSVVAHSPSEYRSLAVNCSAPPSILSYHIHIVYSLTDDQQVAAAEELRSLAREAFKNYLGPDCSCASDPDCRYDNGRLCLIYDHSANESLSGGPFPSGEWSMFTPVDYYGFVVPWFTQNYLRTSPYLSLLVHTNTGCEYEDHSIWALWAGQSWPLNMAIFEKGTQTNEFNQTRGDAGNPICVPENNTCGAPEDGGPTLVCCGGLSCACPGGQTCYCSSKM